VRHWCCDVAGSRRPRSPAWTAEQAGVDLGRGETDSAAWPVSTLTLCRDVEHRMVIAVATLREIWVWFIARASKGDARPTMQALSACPRGEFPMSANFGTYFIGLTGGLWWPVSAEWGPGPTFVEKWFLLLILFSVTANFGASETVLCRVMGKHGCKLTTWRYNLDLWPLTAVMTVNAFHPSTKFEVRRPFPSEDMVHFPSQH